MIPFNDLKPQHQALRAELLEATARVVDSGWFPLGPEAEAFEAEFAACVGCAHGVAVASGTEAIQLGLSALGLEPGDEVLTVANTAVPTVSAITAAGGVPVFVDVDPDTLLMDPARLEARIGPRARIVLPVHLYGQACDMDAVMEGRADLEYDVHGEILPSIEPMDVSSLKLKRPVADVAESDVEEALQNLAEQQRTYEPRKEGAKSKKGDLLVIDYEGRIGGAPVTFKVVPRRGGFLVAARNLDLAGLDDPGVVLGLSVGDRRYAGGGTFRARGSAKWVYP